MIIFSLVSLIPIIGPILVLGYVLAWSREAAWGLDRPISHGVGDLGDMLKLGFFGTVIEFVWVMVLMIIGVGLGSLPSFLGFLGFVAGQVLLIGGFMVCAVAMLRATIYNSITPGFQLKMAWEMSKHDGKGLGRVLLIAIVCSLIVGVIFFLLLLPVLAGVGIFASGVLSGTATLTASVISLGIFAMLWVIVIACLGVFASTLISFVFFRALGMWMEQFKPATWGPSQQLLPFMMAQPAGAVPTQPQQPQQPQPSSQAQPAPQSTPLEPPVVIPPVPATEVLQQEKRPIPMPPVPEEATAVVDPVSNDEDEAPAPVPAEGSSGLAPDVPKAPASGVDDGGKPDKAERE